MEKALLNLSADDAHKQTVAAEEVLTVLQEKDEQISQLLQTVAEKDAMYASLQEMQRRHQHHEQHLHSDKQMVVQELREALARITTLEEELQASQEQVRRLVYEAKIQGGSENQDSQDLMDMRAMVHSLRQELQHSGRDQQLLKEQNQRLEAELSNRSQIIFTMQEEMNQKATILVDNSTKLAQLAGRVEVLQEVESSLRSALGQQERVRTEEQQAHQAALQAHLVAIEAHRTQLKVKDEDLQHLSTRFDQITLELEGATKLTKHHQAQMEGLQKQNQDLESQLQGIAQDREEALRRLEPLQKAKEEAEHDAQVLTQKTTIFHHELSTATARGRDLEAQLAELQARCTELQSRPKLDAKLAQSEEKCKRMEKEVKNREKRLQSLNTDLQSVSKTNEELERQVGKDKDRLQALEQQAQMQIQVVNDGSKNFEELSEAHQQTLRLNQMLQNDLTERHQTLLQVQTRYEGENKSLATTVQEIKEKKARSDEKLKEMKIYAARLRSEREATVAQLKEAQESRLHDLAEQQEATQASISRIIQDKRALEHQLAAAQSQSARDAERMRNEIDELKKNHLEAWTLSEQGRHKMEQSKQKMERMIREREETILTLKTQMHAYHTETESRLQSLKGEAQSLQASLQTAQEQHRQQLDMNQNLEVEITAARTKYTTLSKESQSLRRESLQDQAKLRDQLESLKRSMRKEEEFQHLQLQLQESKEQCKALREDVQRKGKILERLKAERAEDHDKSVKAQEVAADLEDKERRNRKDLTRMHTSMAELRMKISNGNVESRQLQDTIQKLEEKVESLEKDRDQSESLLRATRHSMQQRFSRISSQITQVMTWLVTHSDDVLKQLLRKRSQLKSIAAKKRPPPAVQPLYETAELLSKDFFDMQLEDIIYGKDTLTFLQSKQVPILSSLDVYLHKLHCGLEGKPMSNLSSDTNPQENMDNVVDLPTLFYHIMDKRVNLELLLSHLSAMTQGSSPGPHGYVSKIIKKELDGTG